MKGIAVLAVLLLTACGGGRGIPADVLKPDKMQAVMWDVIRIDAYAADYIAKDSARNDTLENIQLQQEVFAIHNTTREEYYRSYAYYSRNPELMKALMDTMSARVNRSRNRASMITRPAQSQ